MRLFKGLHHSPDEGGGGVSTAVLFTVPYNTCTVQCHEEDRGNVETQRRTWTSDFW